MVGDKICDLIKLTLFQDASVPPKSCPIIVDGFYIETIICLVAAVAWFPWGVKAIRQLQRMPIEAWRVCEG